MNYIAYERSTGQPTASGFMPNDIDKPILNDELDFLKSDTPIPINFKEDRIINNSILKKPLVTIALSKGVIMNDGIDETEISVTISDCQEGETFNSITLSVAGQSFDVSLTDNSGNINFSSRAAGKYLIDVSDKRFRKNTAEVTVNEA